MTSSDPTFPLRLTQAQRRAVAGLLPTLRPRLLLDEANQRTLPFTLDEIREIAEAAKAAVPKAATGMDRNSLRHVADATTKALEASAGIARIPAPERLYQFKITLKGIEPPIWRRIQVKDCTLDKLHEHIQTSMGWTNSHLHQFKINGVIYGDPELIYEGWEDETPPVNSLRIRISRIVPKEGSRFPFEYEYDFGDGWEHEVVFEGCLRADEASDSGLMRIETGKQTRAGRTAPAGVVTLREPHSVGCQRVQVRRANLAAVAAQVRKSKVIG